MKPLPSLSLTNTAHSQNLYSDVEHHSELTSPTHPIYEEAEVFDEEAAEQDVDQQVSDEPTYGETIRGVRSFLG